MTSETYNCNQAPLPFFCPHSNSRNGLSRLIVCINEEPTPFCERVLFSDCVCFISTGENDKVSVHGRKHIVRTVGREEEKEGWRVATSEVGVCCKPEGALGTVVSSLDYSGQGTHVGLDSSQDNRDLLFDWGGRCRIPTKKLLLCLFIILKRQ